MSAQAPERSGRHLSIGEVLSRLRGEFPDITISKIRFLESQGLIDPERTPSGYRKFYAPDLSRLRWILFQQRDHFLPLRVIKERLDAFGPNGAPDGEPPNGEASRAAAAPEVPRPERVEAEPAPPRPQAPQQAPPVARVPPEPPILETPIPAFLEPEQHDEHPEPDVPERDVREPEVQEAAVPEAGVLESDVPEPEVREPEQREPVQREPVQREPAQRESEHESAAAQAQARGPVRMEPPPKPPPPPVVRPDPVVLPFDDFVNKAEDDDEVLGPVSRPDDQPANDDLTRAELLEATGLTDAQLDALEEYGIVAPIAGVGERALYDESALDIAEIAAGFHARGIEARHLKMYWHFAEREGALFAQVLVQYVRQRNPAAKARMQEDLEELARLGRRLRSEMLRRALGNSLGE